MNVYEILNILQAHLKVLQFLAQLQYFSEKLFRSLSWCPQSFIENFGNKLDEFFSDSSLQDLFWINFNDSNKICLHIKNTLCEKRDLVGEFWYL